VAPKASKALLVRLDSLVSLVRLVTQVIQDLPGIRERKVLAEPTPCHLKLWFG
jgi:hypothetical protein